MLGFALADLDNDGKAEIIAHTKDGNIFITSLEGQVIFNDLVSEESSIWHLIVNDTEQEGLKKLIIGGMDGLLRIFRYDSSSNGLKADWAHQFGASISGLLMDDINDDGIVNIIAYSLDKSLRVLNPNDGSLLWGQVFEDGVGDALIYRGEGSIKKNLVIACGNDGTIRAFDGKKGSLEWFKRYSNKMRCLGIIKSSQGPLIACGGDDKLLHLISPSGEEEQAPRECHQYVWKCSSTPDRFSTLFVSTYSFDYLYDDFAGFKEDSRLMSINEGLELDWELARINIEQMKPIKFKEKDCVLFGTTDGLIVLVDSTTGKKLLTIDTGSCVNEVNLVDIDPPIIISCHDNGEIKANSLE